MEDIVATGFRLKNGLVSVLDQQLIPREEVWVECPTLESMVHAIQSLKVRGAPAIGIAASLFVLGESMRGCDVASLLQTVKILRGSRPTAVNLMNYMDRLDRVIGESSAEWKDQLRLEVKAIVEEDFELCERIAEAGVSVVPENPRVLTHCNTGCIATAGRGTALGIVTKLHELGQNVHVYVDETRPLLQGGRLTAWELGKAGIAHTLICDNMAGMLMAQGKVDCVLVGADRIARNGDFANKIGTYSLAVLASYHNVPFYVAAPETTIDRHCPDGNSIPIEERKPEEVRGFSGALGELYWSPDNVATYNPAFDVTPAQLVSGWILDTGVKTRSDWDS